MGEILVCLPAVRLASFGIREGYTPLDRPALAALAAAADALVPRDAAETDEDYRQIVIYCMIRNAEGDVFAYRRRGAEGRLHGKVSIAIGGHVNEGDSLGRSGMDIFHAALAREMDEEVSAQWDVACPPRFLGVISDTSDAVGRVHLGIVAEASASRVYPRSPEHAGFLATPAALRTWTGQLEGWSQILLDQYIQAQ